MTTPLLVITALLLLATGVVVLVAVRLVRALRHTVELEQRVVRLQEGVNLLADTAETGFRQVAAEVERLSAAPAPKPDAAKRDATKQDVPKPAVRKRAAAQAAPRPTAARLRAATRRGRTVQDIAAAEQVSEGEVRLRLSLADASAPKRTRKTTGDGRASLRA